MEWLEPVEGEPKLRDEPVEGELKLRDEPEDEEPKLRDEGVDEEPKPRDEGVEGVLKLREGRVPMELPRLPSLPPRELIPGLVREPPPKRELPLSVPGIRTERSPLPVLPPL